MTVHIYLPTSLLMLGTGLLVLSQALGGYSDYRWLGKRFTVTTSETICLCLFAAGLIFSVFGATGWLLPSLRIKSIHVAEVNWIVYAMALNGVIAILFVCVGNLLDKARKPKPLSLSWLTRKAVLLAQTTFFSVMVALAATLLWLSCLQRFL